MDNIITSFKIPDEVKGLIEIAKEKHHKITVGVIPKVGRYGGILAPDSVIKVLPGLFTENMTVNVNCDAISLYMALPDNKKFLGDNPVHVSPAIMNDTFDFVIFDRTDLMTYVSSIKKEVDMLLGKVKEATDAMYTNF